MLRQQTSHACKAAAMIVLFGATAWTSAYAIGDYNHDDMKRGDKPVHVQMFAPARGDHAGISGRGWFIDLALQYETALDKTGFSAFQLTGPANHNNVAPFPGTFSAGADDARSKAVL